MVGFLLPLESDCTIVFSPHFKLFLFESRLCRTRFCLINARFLMGNHENKFSRPSPSDSAPQLTILFCFSFSLSRCVIDRGTFFRSPSPSLPISPSFWVGALSFFPPKVLGSSSVRRCQPNNIQVDGMTGRRTLNNEQSSRSFPSLPFPPCGELKRRETKKRGRAKSKVADGRLGWLVGWFLVAGCASANSRGLD